MGQVQRPDVYNLLPPILSCLPTAFLSPRPPPALLPLLSPILRQRIHLHASATSSSQQSRSANWLPLLTWSSKRAEQLVEIVHRLQLEPHPVSGEIELFAEDREPQVQYRWLDSETLQSKCAVPQYELAVVWTWCTNDTGGVGLENLGSADAQDGWKVAEILPFDSEDNEEVEPLSPKWSDSLEEAKEAAPIQGNLSNGSGRQAPTLNSTGADNEEDDDAYWAMYDRTPGRTPGLPSPAPGRPSPGPGRFGDSSGLMPVRRTDSSDEQAYFAQYGGVQPAMDSHDPDEQQNVQSLESSFRHTPMQHNREPGPLTNGYPHETGSGYSHMDGSSQALGLVMPQITETPQDSLPLSNGGLAAREGRRIHSPTPSHGSSGSSPVAHLEASASSATAAEIGVKQHISTEMKSLWRLAKAAGIDRSEFERVVRTELEVVGLIDDLSGDESR